MPLQAKQNASLKENIISRRLYLLRHARARFAEPGMRDFDRPLEHTGEEDSAAIGGEMARRAWVPDLVLCSTAARAKETWHATGAVAKRTEMLAELYDVDASGYLDIIRRGLESETSLMLVGHNPMMEDLALALAPADDPFAEQIRRSGFPTAGLAVIDFPAEPAQIQPGTGRFADFLTPAGR